MKLLDTNILLNAINSDSSQYGACCEFLEAVVNSEQMWAMTWGIVYEFLRVATHPGVFPTPLSLEDALNIIMEIATRPNCLVLSETSEHRATLDECLELAPRLSGNILHDFHTAVTMKEHGIADIVTFDRDFRAFPWVRLEFP